MDKWIELIHRKGWLSSSLTKRIRNTKDWYQFYGNINDLRAIWFIENKLHLNVVGFEPVGRGSRILECKASLPDGQDLYVEVKSPLELSENKRKGGAYNYSHKVARHLRRASEKFLDNEANIVILTNDTSPPLQDDVSAQNHIYELFPLYPKISAVGLLGTVFIDDLYEFHWAINESAQTVIEERIFDGFSQICKL